MVDFSHLGFEALAAHLVGNKSKGEGYVQSRALQDLSDYNLEVVLAEYFLSAFSNEEQYHFRHPADLRMNDMYTYCENIFNNKESLLEISGHILHHLYEQSDHPKIKGGELFVVYFTDCLIDDELLDAIGIFKAESKSTFIKVAQQESQLSLGYDEGIDTQKLEKGCLIFNTLREDGYLVKIVDKLSREGEEAKFWKEDFLGLAPVEDSVYTTRSYINLCRDFTQEVIAESEGSSKTEQLAFMNEAVGYMEQNEDFRLNNFAETVIEDEGLRDRFLDYKNSREEEGSFRAEETFEISHQAVNKEKKKIKALIKLDDTFEVKINPKSLDAARLKMERGFAPEKGMSYYTLYFVDES